MHKKACQTWRNLLLVFFVIVTTIDMWNLNIFFQILISARIFLQTSEPVAIDVTARVRLQVRIYVSRDHYDDVIIVVAVVLVRSPSLPDADADAGLAGPAAERRTDTGSRVAGQWQDTHQDTVDTRLQGGLVTRPPLQTLRKLGRILR